MIKKIIVTENQFNIIITEALGIAKVVSDASKLLKKELNQHLQEKNEGEFNFLDIKVIYKIYSFNTEEDFYNWYDVNYKKYINGYSFNDKTLYLTFIKINNILNIDMLDDTIQHELEHYYQTKMAGKDFSSEKYGNAFENLNHYNDYIKYISLIEYFSNHIEVDAFINGAYNSVKSLKLNDYNDFIENTDLKYIKENLITAYNFFRNIPFEGLYFSNMLIFIKQNNFYKNCKDFKSLREKICKKCEKAYLYFLKKSSRTYALIKIKEEEKEKNKSEFQLNKLKRKLNN